MTVLELIIQLKKMPKDLKVVYQAHDNSENEINDWINSACLVDFDKVPKCNWQNNKGKVVALRSSN